VANLRTKEVAVQRCSLLQVLLEVGECARIPGTALASGQRNRRRVHQDSGERARYTAVSFGLRRRVCALEPLNANMSQERKNVACLPCALVIDLVCRHRAVHVEAGVVSRVVEKTQCSKDERRFFPVTEGDVKRLAARRGRIVGGEQVK
jgi:hypothetical protein